MNANKREWLMKDEVFQVVGCAMQVLEVGLILNFKRAKLESKRVVLEESR
jgi:hypothetical protein